MKKLLLLTFLLFSLIGTSQIVIPIGGAIGGVNGNQNISIENNILTLENGGTADLTPYLDNTDSQTITDFSLTGNVLSITLSGGNTQTIDLSGVISGQTLSETLAESNDAGGLSILNLLGISSEYITARRTTNPSPEEGRFYYNSFDDVLRVYTGGEWEDIAYADDISSGSISDSGQGFAYVEKTSGTEEIYNNEDITLSGAATGKKLYNNHITNGATIVLGSGITRYNQTWVEATEDATLTIKKGNGATFIMDGIGLNADDGITIPEYSTVTILALSSNKFRIWVNDYTTYEEIISIYNTSNAISPVNESNSVTDLSVVNIGNTNTPTLVSVASDVNGTGSYSASLSNLNGDAILMIKPPSGLSAGTYTVSADLSITTSSTGAYFYVGNSDDWSYKYTDQYLANTDGTWETHTLVSIVYDGYIDGNSGRVRVYLPNTIAPSDVLKIDNLIWLEDE